MQASEYICFNGKYIQSDHPVFSSDNRAFRYGDALFETIYTSGKIIPFFSDHFNRLTSSMKILKMQLQSDFRQDRIHKEIIGLLNRNKLFHGARIRLTVFRNNGGLYAPASNQTSYIIEGQKVENDKYILNGRGLIIDVYEDIRKPVNILSNLKTGNSLLFILAGIYKTERKIDDCIILNENNNICEAIGSNIFVVKDNIIFTPSLGDGCVFGIMREQIIRIAMKQNYTVYDDCSLQLKDLLEADELFLTNAVSGIKWVIGLRNRRYYNRISKKMNEILSEGLLRRMK